jgi:hypothetical protein
MTLGSLLATWTRFAGTLHGRIQPSVARRLITDW